MNEETRLKLFQQFFDPNNIRWEKVGDFMEFRIDNGFFIIDENVGRYNRFLRSYNLPPLAKVWGRRFFFKGIVALVCRIHCWDFASRVNGMKNLSLWERSKFVLATKDVRVISEKLLRLPTEDQISPEIEKLLKKVACYRLSKIQK